MPKLIPKEQKRVPLNCLIAPATMALITEAVAAVPEWSQGGVIDRAIGLFSTRMNAQGLTFEEQRAEIDRHEADVLEAIRPQPAIEAAIQPSLAPRTLMMVGAKSLSDIVIEQRGPKRGPDNRKRVTFVRGIREKGNKER